MLKVLNTSFVHQHKLSRGMVKSNGHSNQMASNLELTTTSAFINYVAAMVLTFCMLLLPTSTKAQEAFDPLLKKLPAFTNSIMVVDVAAVHKSPLAIKEGWKNLHEGLYVNSPLILPPECDRIVVGSQMNPNDHFHKSWEIAVMSLTEKLPMLSIARAEGGYVDRIVDTDVAWVPSDAYFMSLENNFLGVMKPAHRQAVAFWVEQQKSQPKSMLSNYLTQNAYIVRGDTQIVMALDLVNAVQPHILHDKLQNLAETKDNPEKIRTWERVIQSIQGVSLKVNISDKMLGVLKIDFLEPVAALGNDIKPMLLKSLADNAVYLDEFETWKFKQETLSLILEGELTKPGMRKLFSLLELPSAKFSALKSESGKSSSDTSVIAKSTLTYYKSLTTLLGDMEKEYKRSRDARHNAAATFLSRYADRIDKLPILNVDNQMLDFGASVAVSLRNNANASRQAGINTGVQNAQAYSNYTNYYYDSGYYGVRAGVASGEATRRAEESTAIMKRFGSWAEIETEIATMRRTMTAKYNLPF